MLTCESHEAQAGVEGVMVDVWWGIVEHAGPRRYDFSAYKRLFDRIAASGLKVQAVMSFHAAGGNVGDTCNISLPRWVVRPLPRRLDGDIACGAKSTRTHGAVCCPAIEHKREHDHSHATRTIATISPSSALSFVAGCLQSRIGEENPDIFYTDKSGYRNRECLSLGCDDEPLLAGRTPVEVYSDFIEAFSDSFDRMFGALALTTCLLRLMVHHLGALKHRVTL